MLLFKDAIRLFAAYNEGIINLLGKRELCGITLQSRHVDRRPFLALSLYVETEGIGTEKWLKFGYFKEQIFGFF